MNSSRVAYPRRTYGVHMYIRSSPTRCQQPDMSRRGPLSSKGSAFVLYFHINMAEQAKRMPAILCCPARSAVFNAVWCCHNGAPYVPYPTYPVIIGLHYGVRCNAQITKDPTLLMSTSKSHKVGVFAVRKTKRLAGSAHGSPCATGPPTDACL